MIMIEILIELIKWNQLMLNNKLENNNSDCNWLKKNKLSKKWLKWKCKTELKKLFDQK